jgi:tetratricopeptide (TPR) repeat protein
MIYVVVALVALTAVVIILLPERELNCPSAMKVSDSVAVAVCQREYERTGEPIIGAYFADVLRRTGNTRGATAVANGLLGTPVRADALQILGKIAVEQRRGDDAIKLLEDARQLHRAAGNHLQLARDDMAIATIQSERAQYGGALQTMDEAISQARLGGDAVTEAYCHMTAARMLIRVGYFEAAHSELDRAASGISSDRDLAQLWFVRGVLDHEAVRMPPGRTHYIQAVAEFERSLELAQRAGLTTVFLNLHLNLASSLADLGRTDDADRHLSEAAALDSDNTYEVQRHEIAARIAYRRGNYSLASSLNTQVYPMIEDNDERIDVCVMQARIALAARDFAVAELWAARGVENAEQIRAAQTLSELRPWVLSTRREPFEVLFSIYARGNRIKEALGVFDRWQGRTLLDEMARPSTESSPGLETTATRIQRLGQWLPVASMAPTMNTDAQAVLQTLEKIDLIALAVSEGRVWRFTGIHGRLELNDLGNLDDLRHRFDQFSTQPTNPAHADVLGALILPSDVMRKTSEPLYVLLDAPIGELPVVALRRGDQPLIAVRPVLRTPRFPVVDACARRSDVGGAVILADAAGDLPEARGESTRIASLLGTTPLIGARTTSAALFAARSAQLVHIAVHADVDDHGGVLRLYDRSVSAAEISANKLGPARVVLSSASTARSSDPEFARALSTAFLAGGSDLVVATVRPVTDAGARELMQRFYDGGGASDPIHALARVQAQLAKTDNKDWHEFAVFGVCSPPS